MTALSHRMDLLISKELCHLNVFLVKTGNAFNAVSMRLWPVMKLQYLEVYRRGGF